ncbi:MAG TPA: hypothetical protein V6C84_18660 [Coleofasciculaceae cyanobacterium]
MGKPPKTYSESIAEQIGTQLDTLAENPKGIQVKELVSRMRSKIEAAQAVGHTLEDIVKVFEDEGVAITLNTLKQYLRESRTSASDSDAPAPPEATPKPAKLKKSDLPPASQSQPLPQTKSQATKSSSLEPQSEVKPRLTNTNKDGFQEMRSDDDL